MNKWRKRSKKKSSSATFQIFMILGCLFVCLLSIPWMPYLFAKDLFKFFYKATTSTTSAAAAVEATTEVAVAVMVVASVAHIYTWNINVLNNKSTITYPKRFIIFLVTYHFRRFLCICQPFQAELRVQIRWFSLVFALCCWHIHYTFRVDVLYINLKMFTFNFIFNHLYSYSPSLSLSLSLPLAYAA